MFTPKHLLVNCVTLLCLENRDGVNTSTSKELVRELLEALPIPESAIDHDHGRQTFLELRQTVIWLNSRAETEFPTDQEVLQAVQVACKEQTWLFEAIMNPLLENYESTKDIIKIIQNFRSTIHKYLNDEKIRGVVKETSHRLMFKKDILEPLDEVRELVERLEPFLSERSKLAHPSLTGSMDFSEPESIAKEFDNVKTLMSTDGALRTGWKAINRMLGKVGAIKRGELALVGGLQHSFKSGFMLSLFVHFALFNKPVLRDKTKTPLLVFFTFENEITDNLLWIYKYIVENETGKPVIESEINADEAAKFVGERLRANGFEVKMLRFDPTEFTAAGFIGILDGFIADGYEIIGLLIDYLNMLSKSGIEAKVHGDDIRLLFRRIRNYCSPRGIACVSPHQLSSDALQLTRENVEDFVKTVANKGYYDGCKRLGQEPDIEILIHKIVVNGASFLTVNRGKHRNAVTPVADQYTVLPFKDVGTIPYDVESDYDISEETFARSTNGAAAAEESEWWNG